MKTRSELKPLVVAVSAVLATGTFVISTANADENPFQMTELSSGYMVADAHGAAQEGATEEEKTEEGKCGEGKCGEGKCGGEESGADASEDGKTEEGKCGEGKCGGG
ncbi:MAG: hypothetical protein F4X93_05840 [Proteobacteria bacterium]|nr:hypothetical protein [Pseudomonadota bacterium]